MKKFFPILWALLAGTILLLDYCTGATVILTVLLSFPVALASWFNSRAWGLALAIAAPLVRLSFHSSWTTSLSLSEAVVNNAVAFVTFATFAVLIDLVANQRAEIRVLQGILPTCAWCKKIRNADNQWQQMESFISERSEAEFSHGICPDCAKEHFPKAAGQESLPN